MCGFCGFTGELIESDEILTKMMDKIVHRGKAYRRRSGHGIQKAKHYRP